ncbi:apolipophorins [Lucilia cuprina]|uniref:apolipophorins n=1 Tax=Lucilia cuprina TaxID=7375 RepID=UPI001F06EF3D|nr:apolipophorins [Lucilia cuprina]
MRAQNHCPLRLRLAVQGVVLLCILISSGTNAESSCNRGCPESDNGYLSYTPGNVYEYNFDSIMTVGINSGAGNSDDTSLKITGNAKLFAEGNCGYTLQLGAVKVTATKENVEKKIMQSIQKPVHFTMVGGKVEPELCADQGDNAYALNIKRAVISMLQSKPDAVQEVDVFGQCPTHTTVSKIGNAEIVNKVRNLNACGYRKIINSGILTNALQTKPGLESASVLKADYTKESKIEKGVVNNVQLVEEYKYVAVPKSDVGLRAKVVTNLKLRNPSGAPAAAPQTGARSVSIMFQQPETYSSKNIAALKSSLTELVQLLEGYVKKDSAKGFVELIRLMRNSDTETLLELAAFPLPNKVLARQVYLDALFRTATSESARAILKQFNKMSEKEKTIAMMSLNLVQTVDKDTLNQAATLLNPNAIKEVYLAVGSLVSKYCERNGCNNGEVDAISKKFTESLKHCKANTKKDEERVLYILKGIGNTHHLASSVASSLTECVQQGRSNRMRVAALQAFSAASCDANLQKKAMELLVDRNEDSELRIEAYLAAIKCPSGELANEIAEVVNNETVNQVGGFITSSLRAIRDSTDEEKENQRRYLGNIRVTKKFPMDFRRYSYNDEISYKMDALGLSASADYKLIYSQSGFLPRSARLNVKAEEFGINMNILDASVRQENLENVLEYFFGPKGFVNKDLDEMMGKESDKHNSRSRRSIADDTSKVAKKYKTYGAKNANDLNLDLSLKVFGSEILFLSLGDNIPSTFDDITKEFTEAFEKIKNELNNYNKEFTSHNFFMDTEIVYPTGVGIPLELTSDGFMANKMDFGVSVDVDNLLQSKWENSKYKIKFVPSIDANVNLKIGFNALVLSSGLRSVFTMHSATGSSIDVAITHEGAGFDMNVELPREKIELIDMKMQNDFYVAEQDKSVKSVPLKTSKSDANGPSIESCYNQFESLGFTPCVVGSFGDLKEDGLTEAFDFAVYVMTERHFNLKGYHNGQQAGVDQWKLDYSTPGSKESHDTSLTMELGTKPRAYGRASLDNSRYHFAVEAGLNNDDRELVWYAQYEQDKDVRKSKLGFIKSGNEYRPVIEIQDANGGVSNEINGYRVDGRVLVQKSGDQSRLNFENLMVSNKEERVLLNGFADLGPASMSSELHLTSNEDTIYIKSNLKVAAGEYAAGLFVNDEKKPENVYGASANVKVGEQSVSVDVVSKFAKWEATSTNEVEYSKQEGPNPIASSKFTSSVSVKHKQHNVGSLKVQGLTEGQDKFEVIVDAASGKKVAAVAVKYAANQKAQNDYQLSVNAKLNQHFVDVVSKCDIVGNHFVLDNVLTTSWGSALTLKGELGQRYTPQDIYMDLQGTAQVSGKDKPTQWILKVIGAPEKTNSEFKVSRDNAEIIKVVADTQHPQDKITSGKVNLIVKNVVTAKGDFKLAKNGKGEVAAVIETLKTDPKHKLELSSKFHVQHPKYDIEANVILDGEQKVFIKTENIVDKLKFNTKNMVDVSQKKVSFDANGSIKGDWRMNGEIQGSFTFTCPEGRVLSGSLKRKINTNGKTGISQGHMDVQLVDQLPSDGNKRSLALNGKLEKFNVKSKEFSATTQLVYTNFESQTLDVNCHLKKLPKGQNKMIDFGTTVNGPLVKSPIDVTFIVDEYSVRHAIFNIGAKYGDAVNVKINGNYDMGERGSALKYELNSNIELPHTSFKTYELHTKGQFMEPQTEGGNYIFELFVDEKAGSEQFVKLTTNVKSSEKNGAFNINLSTQNMQAPLEIDGSYQREHQGSFKEDNASGSVKYDFNFKHGDKFVKSSNDLSYNGKETLHNRLTVTSSFEGARNLDVEIRGKLLDADSYNLNVVGNHNEHSYSLDTVMYRGNHKKGVQISASLPNGQPISIVAIFEVMGRRKSKVTTELSNVFDLDLKFNGEASYNAVDDFYIVAQWNSVKLKLDNYDLDVRTQGKSLSLMLKNAQGEIFSGTATCALKKENNKSILEGQGQIRFKGTTQNTNFRLTRQIYEMTTDKEVGFSFNFNGNFGPKNGVSTLKITNKDFNIKLSICEEKKQCTNVQVLASNDLTQDETSIHSLLVLFDLREIGFPYEFELQSKNVREGFKFQYMLDSSINSNNNLKYNLLANVQPTNAKVQLKLPSREILLEAHQKYPVNGQIFGHYENSLAFFIDKTNKPHDVTRFLAQADLSGKERVAINAKGLLKLEHPTIRPLIVSGKLDANREHHTINAEVIFDIFKLPEQQIVATTHVQNIKSNNGFNITSTEVVRSSGLGFEYTLNAHAGLNTEKYEFSSGADLSLGSSDLKASAFVFGNKEHAEVLIYSLNEEVVKMVADYNKQKKQTKLNAKLQALGRKPVEINAELLPTMAKINVVREGLLNAQGEIKLGKELKFAVEGANKELINGRVGLDSGNFLRTTYNAHEENVKEFMNVLENEMKQETEVTTELKQRFEKLKEMVDRQLQLSKDSAPDFRQLKNSYQNNLNEIVKELEVDPAMKQISETLQNLYSKIAKLSTELTKLWSETYEKLHKSFVALHEKFQVIVKETLVPAWEEFLTNTGKIVRELRLEIVNMYSKSFKSVLDVFKQYEPALKNYGKAIAEGLKPFNEAVQELYKALASGLEDLVNEWIEYWSKLPSFEAIQSELRDKMHALQLGEKSLEFVNNVFDQLHVLPLTAETSEFLQKVHEYVVAKLKHQQVDDEKVVEELVKLFVKAVRSVWASLEMAAPTGASITSFSLNDLFMSAPVPTDFFSQLPALITFRSSVINFLINEDFENWFTKEDFIFNDFDLRGHIADGRHVFTFDGQHLYFTGNCKYILAQDSVDNNFTVIAQVNNGKMKSIFVTDREGQFMEINDNGVLKLNGNPVEYPQHENGMHAWRLYYTVYMVSEYGVQIMCTNDLKVCHVDVNGFYTSKMRGLLGNGNAEPYDDFVQIDGSIAGDAATFVNGYGLGKCNPATVDTHTEIQRTEICNELFGYESPLALGYLFIDSKPYRNACDQSVLTAAEKDKETVACSVATAYASALKLEDIFVFLPKRCLKCSGQAGQRELGEEFTLKVPTNKADIVFVVDVDVTSIVMRNLIAPVVTEVRDTLKSRGFTDVQIGVVAYSANQRYPAVLTSDNGKLNYQGNLADVKLNGPKPIFESTVSQMITEKKVLDIFEILEDIVKSIVPQSDELAFRMALNYPFRAGAAKSIVAVRSNNLEYDNMMKFVRAHVIGAVTQFDAALLHVIGPVKDMSLEGVPTEKLIGFNSRLVATLDGKDAKKRAKLQFHNDMGIDFVLNNGGWVFATQNFEQLKPQEQKKALNQITTSVADTLFKTEIVTDCRCMPVHGIHAQHKCVIKSSNFVPNKKVKA